MDPSVGSRQSVHDSRYYNVHYQPVQPLGKALSAVARDQHVILYNLAAGTRYEFKVRTVRGTQTSRYSATVTNTTSEIGKYKESICSYTELPLTANVTLSAAQTVWGCLCRRLQYVV